MQFVGEDLKESYINCLFFYRELFSFWRNSETTNSSVQDVSVCFCRSQTPFNAHYPSVIGCEATMHVTYLGKRMQPAQWDYVTNEWCTYSIWVINQGDGSAHCFYASRLIGCSVFVCRLLGLSRDSCVSSLKLSVELPTCSPVQSSGNALAKLQRRNDWLFLAVVSTRNTGVSGERSVVMCRWMTVVNRGSLFLSRHQGEPVGVRISLVAPLHPPQHPPLPPALLPHHSRHHRQHHGQVQRHPARGEPAGQSWKPTCNLCASFFVFFEPLRCR